MAKNIFEPMMAKLKADPKKIVFTEGTDERILEASSRLLKDGFLTPVLVGKVEEVKAAAEKFGFDITGAEIVDPDNFDKFDEMVELFCELRKKKGVTPEQALELTDNDEIKEEKKILESIVRFGDETAKEVMTSRQDVTVLDMQSSFPDVLKCIVENNYSRIPVYQDSIDNVRGILYIKDLLPHLGKPSTFRWQSLIRPPYFVPETKKIDDLLREFQNNKVHIAIVVDECGGTSGIVTLEDILEEIVGEINDEYDEDEKTFVRLNKNTYIFEGKTLLSDFYKTLNIDDEEFEDIVGDADTLAGLLLEIKGEFPKINEKIVHVLCYLFVLVVQHQFLEETYLVCKVTVFFWIFQGKLSDNFKSALIFALLDVNAGHYLCEDFLSFLLSLCFGRLCFFFLGWLLIELYTSILLFQEPFHHAISIHGCYVCLLLLLFVLQHIGDIVLGSIHGNPAGGLLYRQCTQEIIYELVRAL